MRIHRLRTRIIFFFVVLLALVQLAALVLVNVANTHSAHAKAEADLDVGERVFDRLLQQRAQELSQAARVLAADFAFREAVATGDSKTIISALGNHGRRIGAAAMLFVGLDGRVAGDTLSPDRVPRAFEFPVLLSNPGPESSPAMIGFLSGRTLQLVAVPVNSPLSIGWVVVGVPIDDELARDLRQLTSLDVSFAIKHRREIWQGIGSTLGDSAEHALIERLSESPKYRSTQTVRLDQDDQQTRAIPLEAVGDIQVVAVLGRSLSEALASFHGLRTTLVGLVLASLIVSIAGSVLIASNITRPLSQLAEAAGRIEHGDYVTGVPIQRADEVGRLALSLNHMRDAISEREQRILKLAYRDTLTGLDNRAKFAEQLAAAIGQADSSRRGVSILVMDLDRFKYVNDTLGHSVGDHVLVEVAKRLVDEVPQAACIARLGGDEFAVLLEGLSTAQIADIARKVNRVLEQPISYRGQPLDVGTSIGVAHHPEHGENAATLVRNADIAMYVAKRNKSGYEIYDRHYDTTQQQHLSLLGELRQAVEAHQLRLYYQPKVSLSSANVSAAEALLRWHHPQRGMISPAEFIPFAEHTGYIKVLTRWVIQEAVRQCAEWIEAGVRIEISVNISARDLMNRDLPEMVSSLLKQYAVPATLLCLEITESGFMEDPTHARNVLDQLSKLGLKLSIDDYGTGYSSLSYIMQLPVQELKIDRSFISRMVADADISTIVRSTIDLGHNLGLKVVAEGVESREGWNLLARLGCDDAQGFYMSPPVDAEALLRWIRSRETSQSVETPEAMLADGSS